MIDLDYYAWRESTKDVSGNDRLLIPRADPDEYESDFGFIYETAEDAIDARDELIDDERVCILTGEDGENEDDCLTHEHEPHDAEKWVLVHYVGTIVNMEDSPIADLERAFETILADTDNRQLRNKRAIEMHTKLSRLVGDPNVTDKDKTRLDALGDRLLTEIFGIDPRTS